ncbi:ExbD/TolR family protein [Celerinatantimonas yamalensis]|uniref:Biopolymer transporter ExbD n=1 Tax=Celerinatantimonas yamalensis TaxID=559956 RepID=A0ABW9G5U7_9GAMM
MRRSRLFQQQTTEEAQIDLTPMLDIVFIMLIFFIVSTSFVQESGVKVERPVASTATKQSQSAQVIGLSENGQIWLNHQRIDVRLLSASINQIKASQPRFAVIIEADKRATTGALISVIDILRQAGIPYRVATQKSQAN